MRCSGSEGATAGMTGAGEACAGTRTQSSGSEGAKASASNSTSRPTGPTAPASNASNMLASAGA
jgi:hypothetical protein